LGSAPSRARSSSRRPGSASSSRSGTSGRATSIALDPDAWQGYYNFACLEALSGDNEAALRHLERAAELAPEIVPEAAAKDEDFESLRDDERFLEITGQANTAGTSS
jgi:hypothetical protein